MTNHPFRDLHDFESALRDWGERPPQTPPGVAARRLVLPARVPSRLPLWQLAAAAVLVWGVFLGAWYGAFGPAVGPAVTVSTVMEPLPDNVMVFWVDAQTPVYFVLSPLGSPKGDPS
ncbi:MAG: hypothetical protein ACOY3Y_20485 [Acidobacteriota bacterium]